MRSVEGYGASDGKCQVLDVVLSSLLATSVSGGALHHVQQAERTQVHDRLRIYLSLQTIMTVI